jgi:multiple sugar transport system substrate-binding protein
MLIGGCGHLIRRIAFRGLLLLALTAAPLHAAEQAQRALSAVADLIANGEIASGETLKLAFKPGNINALLGADLELQREWEEKTGTRISARVMPNQPTLANFASYPEFDLTVGRPHEHRELVDKGLITPLDDLARRFGFSLADDTASGFIRPRLQAYLGDRLVAIPADGDVALLYLRRDLLDNPVEQKAYKAKTGRDLKLPVTWAEYDAQVRFFHRPGKGLYGSAEERDPEGGWMFWLQRYLSQRAPYQPLFDEQARPLINSPAGIDATEHYVHSARHAPPGATEPGNDYSFVLPIFMQGKAYSLVNTIAGAKLLNGAGSQVRDRFLVAPMPGKRVGGTVLRRNVPIYGNNLMVAAASRNQALAFLFAMWLTDPDVSLRTVGARGGHTDPYRWHHAHDPRIEALYTPAALAVFRREWAFAVPAGLGVVNESEYGAVLDRNLWQAARGEISATEAMARTAREWEVLTERLGRDRQIASLAAFRDEMQRQEPLPADVR